MSPPPASRRDIRHETLPATRDTSVSPIGDSPVYIPTPVKDLSGSITPADDFEMVYPKSPCVYHYRGG